MRALALTLCVLGLALAIAWPDGGANLLIGNDTPEHLFGAFARNHLHERAFGFGRFYAAHTPVTGHGYVEVVRLLEPALGWGAAHRVALVVLAELWALAFGALVLSSSRERWPVALLGFPLALPWLFYVGDYPMYAGATCALLALALGLPARPTPSIHTVGLAFALMGAALCDPLPALVAAACIVALGIARLFTRNAPAPAVAPPHPARALAWLLGACLPATVIVVLARAALGGDESVSMLQPAVPLGGLVHHVLAGSVVRGAMHAVLVVAALVLGLKHGPSRPTAALGALLLVTALVMPTRAQALLLTLSSALLLSLLPWERTSKAMRRALAPALAVWLVASGVSAVALHRAMAGALRPALGLLDGTAMTARFAPTALRQPLLLAPVDATNVGIPGWSPLLHVDKLYAIAGVGVAPAHSAAPARSLAGAHLSVRPELPAGIDARSMPGLSQGVDGDDAGVHARKVVQLASASRTIGRVFLLGRDGDIDALVRRGWRVEARTSHAGLLSFHGCDVTLHVTGPGPRTLMIAPRVQGGSVEPETTVTVAGPGDFPVRGLSCGPALLTSRPPCAGADASGQRESAIVNGGQVTCHPP